MKEMIMDFSRKSPLYSPSLSSGLRWRELTVKFLGLNVMTNLSWGKNAAAVEKKAQQWLYFIRLLKKAGLSHRPLTQAYRGLIESILTNGITVWFGNTTQAERKALQRVLKTAERISGSDLPSTNTVRNAAAKMYRASSGGHTSQLTLCSGTNTQHITWDTADQTVSTHTKHVSIIIPFKPQSDWW